MTDPLATLGLGRGATAEDIRAARRRLAKSHHPDQGGDAADMQRINEAADAALQAVGSEPAGPAADPPAAHHAERPPSSSNALGSG